MKQRENENEEGEKPEHSKATVGNRKLVGHGKIKKGIVKKENKPSDEMPVMPTQVLMRATALVDAPLGDKPMTRNSVLQTVRDRALKREN